MKLLEIQRIIKNIRNECRIKVWIHSYVTAGTRETEENGTLVSMLFSKQAYIGFKIQRIVTHFLDDFDGMS